MIFWELKKIFKCRIGLIVIALFIFICGVMSFLKPTLETENPYRNEQYELVKDTRYEKEIESNEEYKDIDFYKVINHRADHSFMSIVMVIILVLIFSNIYTNEKISGVDNIIFSSKNKMNVLYSKLALAIILPIVIYGFYLGIESLVTFVQCGKPVNGGLGAFRIVKNSLFLKRAFTINEYLLLKVGTMLLIFISISIFSSFFSFISSSSLSSISAVLMFIGVGKVCTLIRFLPNALLNILSKVNYIDLIFYPDQFVGIYAGDVYILGKNLDLINLCNGILIGSIFIGVILCVFTFKKILTK
ncbi:hypothetical protein FQB35_05290 [Crassaminicella thermophila]|uniref:ABC-2 family transporter protein n=1 Tax=Crassaminicella thermophila TaxID=2599308 RepID=A0A5C0SD62_CRATE|nr:hypothetical protein [Crassaminicella thermophila]QEK11827.1 hypothetical protein FQB35_05290 [Crassaminicella thermophila]